MHRERKVLYDVIAQGQLGGIRISAPSVQRLFIDAGLALSDYRISLDLVKDVDKHTIQVSGTSLEALFKNWLNANAALFNEKKYLPYRIVFTVFDGKKIEATLTGETYESHRHGYPKPFNELSREGFSFQPAPDDAGLFHAQFLLTSAS